ncbi:uncharacterized protein N7477_001278 [Penicillium maclennaniae]|uniref:uncharacterized protein n=1 Tax=Penicillium maclennaniae TaxID=1343394 RepID=UPI00254236A9|nr:uncharacterized protein N7477_001278 [Penicillium maclennaniae]KAJ5681338.1 hypothetical protein N7477_001278 [Penicillium maclennaniae]
MVSQHSLPRQQYSQHISNTWANMAFGVLESKLDSCPSGSTNIQSDLSNAGMESHMERVPRPSDSPLDPLNWPRARKELLFATIVLGSCATGSLGPVLVPGFTAVAHELQVSVGHITLLNGALVMALGVSAYLCSSSTAIFGKRLVYIFTTLLDMKANSSTKGLGMGGFFALAGTASINEVFFVHERGLRVGLWNFGVITSVNLTPVISGYVISNLSWRWSFWLEAIMFGVVLMAVFALFPETTFERASVSSVHPESAALENKGNQVSMGSASSPDLQLVVWRSILRLQLVQVPGTRDFLTNIVQPLALLLHPIVIRGSLMWAVTFTWTILLGAVVSQIFTPFPYGMDTIAVGNLSGIAPFIGSALGTVIGGYVCDFCAVYLANHNDGYYEPEFRLIVILPATITMAIGTFGLGAAIHNALPATVCGVFMAIINFAVGLGCTAIVGYTNDACGHRTSDVFGIAMVSTTYPKVLPLPHVLSFVIGREKRLHFGLSFVFNDYCTNYGPLIFFSTFGALTVGIMLTSLPMYCFGKRIRAWADRRNILH